MKVLIVCSGNFPEPEKNFHIHQAFISDQISALRKNHPVEIDVFLIKGKGIRGYLANLSKLKNKIDQGYDLVHAHYSLSGFLAGMQRKKRVLTTFHGSDINLGKLRLISQLASLITSHSIYVSEKLRSKIIVSDRKASVIPCGVDLDVFYPEEQAKLRKTENLLPGKKYILFASSFTNHVKNYPLAQRAIELLDQEVEVLELVDRSREGVRNLLNAVDLLLLTSFSEGSPQVIKEAMACNCPIVSTDVGDVRSILSGTFNCYVTSNNPEEIAARISEILTKEQRSNGREHINAFDNKRVVSKIYDLYEYYLKKY